MASQNKEKSKKTPANKNEASKALKNAKIININEDEYGTLELIASGALGEHKNLADDDIIKQIAKTGEYKKQLMPYAFSFAPSGKENQKMLKNLKAKTNTDALKPKTITFDLCLNGKIAGKIQASNIYNLSHQNLSIFSAKNINFTKEKSQNNALAIAGELSIFSSKLAKIKTQIAKTIKERNYRKITAIMLTADPLHRLHERLIRMTIDKADFLIIFLVRTYNIQGRLSFDLRLECLRYFCDNYLPSGRVAIVPFENTTIFSDHINPVLEVITAKNFGANKIVIGQNHAGIGLFYDNNQANTLLDEVCERLGLELIVMPQMFYCEICHTLTSTKTCPHGDHHHIKYSQATLKELLFAGLMPPAILMRKKISAIILDALYPNRFKSLQRIYDDLFANRGILEKHDQRDFYEQLMRLYQTSSLN